MAGRKPFEGVLNVVRFNWPLYVIGLAVYILTAVIAVTLPIPYFIVILLMIIGWAALYFIVMSLVASYLAYDASGLYDLMWLQKLLKQTPQNIVNLHAGFDETSESLKSLFPDAQLSVLDFYNPGSKTESSLLRARKYFKSVARARIVNITNLGMPDASTDMALLCFCAHEVRSSWEREKLFCELKRIVKLDGWVILIEHMRDIANFLVFGPGCLHFLPYAEWKRLATLAGFKIKKELSITPFTRILCLYQA